VPALVSTGDWDAALAGFLARLGMLVFGRATYELMASYWPTPTAIENDPHVANAMNALPKVVFSRTLKTADWQNTRLVSTDAAVEVANLKQQAGKEAGRANTPPWRRTSFLT
jgi:dihydrofolate reductase